MNDGERVPRKPKKVTVHLDQVPGEPHRITCSVCLRLFTLDWDEAHEEKAQRETEQVVAA